MKKIAVEWWQSLAAREQKILMIGAIMAAVLIIYAFIWLPFNNAVSSLRKEIQNQQQLIPWMEQMVPRLQALKRSSSKMESMGNQSLLAFSDNSLRKNHLHRFITELQQTANQEVSLKFNSVPFDNLMNWLTMIWKHYGIQATAANIEPTTKEGLTKAELILKK